MPGGVARARGFRLALLLIVFFLLFVCLIIGSLNYPLPSALASMGPIMPLHSREQSRLLVVAPHPDDETLGAGAFIQQHVAAGGQVKVVIVTNGDGFRIAGGRTMEKVRLSSKDFISLGLIRRQEAIEALRNLGVQSQDVIFLGFPDRGLANLWTVSWSKSYRSPYTKQNTVPYERSRDIGVPYTGQELVNQLKQIITEYNPETVVAPSLADLHPDHHATALFVRTALQDSPVKTLLEYTIHREEWRIVMANKLTSHMDQWLEGADADPSPAVVDPTRLAIEAKRRAILAYQSQVKVMPRFMMSHVSRPEVFLKVDLTQPGCCAKIKRKAATGVHREQPVRRLSGSYGDLP